jgi:hypothetical protein
LNSATFHTADRHLQTSQTHYEITPNPTPNQSDMKDRILTIPKALHEFHGEKATVTNILFVYGTGLIAAAVFICFLLPLKLPLWKYVLSALLILDIGSGLVANLSSSTNQYYQQHKKLRIPFLLLHVVHPILFWVVFPEMLNFFLFMALYPILSSLLVNYFKNCEFQQNMASSLVVIGILFSFMFKSDGLILYSLVPLFLIKLVLGFSVKRPDYRMVNNE